MVAAAQEPQVMRREELVLGGARRYWLFKKAVRFLPLTFGRYGK